MARSFPRSALRSPHSRHSNRRSTLSVSFEDQQSIEKADHSVIFSSPLKLLNGDDSFTSRDKLDLSRELHSSFTSSASGLSIEEITCEEVDDILPKTDYTYTKTASYSAKYLGRKRYRSPNMSRRKVRGSKPVFLSDDEDEFEEDNYRESASVSRSVNQQRAMGDLEDFPSSDQGSEASTGRGRRSRGGHFIYTSTPHERHHISTHDHYYDGMLLRSGHKVEGVKWHMDKDGMVYEYDASGTALLPTPIGHSSELDMSRLRGSMTTNSSIGSRILNTLKTTTTTITSSVNNQRQRRMSSRGKKSLMLEAEDEMAESKLRLDETETEKHGKQKTNEYFIKHMYGMDSDEDISDVDVVDYSRSAKTKSTYALQNNGSHSNKRFSFFTYITTLVTTIITTVTTTFTEGSVISGVKSAAAMTGQAVVTPTRWLFGNLAQFLSWLVMRSAISKAVVVPTRWLLRRVAQFSSWLIMSSATLLLYEIDMKQRRRRAGCCCWLLPLLLLLPLALLVLYYWHPLAEASHLSQVGHMTGQVGSSVYSGLFDAVSATTGTVSSGLSYMWLWLTALTLTSSKTQDTGSRLPVQPVPPKPVVLQAAESAGGVDLDQLYLYIQEKVEHTWQVKGDQLRQQIQQIQIPEGLTREDVEAILAVALAGETAAMKDRINTLSTDLKSLLESRSMLLETRIAELESEIRNAAQQQQMLMGSFEQTKSSFNSISVEERSQLSAASAALDAKLADLSATVDHLSSQNAALTALMGNCCRNNSLLADTVKAHVISILTEMGTDESSPLAGVFGWMGSQYVEKPELDRRMEAVSAEVQERMVKSIVDEALAQFSADRVGLPDFALESAGGSVLSVRCSETYYHKTALVSVFGLPLWYTSNSPRTVIQPNVHPGECWAFKGQSGYIVLQLSHPIQVTGFTLEHIPRSLAPRGDISSAPYKFSVFGLVSESDTHGMNLGNYTYEDNGRPIQHYDVQRVFFLSTSLEPTSGVYQLVELRVQTNHGNLDYTCIYRFRVHGLP
ncbi:hypothetical protein EGW08_016711 [Elysia chlorotica]|uniref:SUN domain-containing protein n=1 Tax=Elysia chlorotica TaxID=188477 RepID=A0A433T1T7_ELYCH|nr:hypothetical protein EGW08_016711 [Elysia chlorotica]